MGIPLTIPAAKFVYVSQVDANGAPLIYAYKYPHPTPTPAGIDCTQCEVVGYSTDGGAPGANVEFASDGLAYAPNSVLAVGEPVYCDDNGDPSATPGTRAIRCGHALGEQWFWVRIENAEA